MPKLTVEGVGEFEVPTGKRLVLALEDEAKIDQLHACGGNARCTTCRVQFVAGEPDKMTVAEKNVLAARGLTGIRLSCQISCDHDMTLQANSRLAGSGRKDAGRDPQRQFSQNRWSGLISSSGKRRMPSPFPGMNPYLEQDDVWEDFHHNFLTWSEAALNGSFGANYLARIESRLYIRELSDDERRFFGRADLAVAATRGEAVTVAVAEIAAPVELLLPDVDTARDSWLEIRDRRDRRVITVIELLSPTNKKRGPDRDAYLSKRNGILASPTHLVEIDLRRDGERPALPQLPGCDYYAFISQYELRPRIGFWPISLRDRLPKIQIPLSSPDPAVDLDLQPILDRTYDLADYGKTIYSELPEPPLSVTDAEWARQFVPASTD